MKFENLIETGLEGEIIYAGRRRRSAKESQCFSGYKEKKHTNREPVSYSWLTEFADSWLINARNSARAWQSTDTYTRPPVVGGRVEPMGSDN